MFERLHFRDPYNDRVTWLGKWATKIVLGSSILAIAACGNKSGPTPNIASSPAASSIAPPSPANTPHTPAAGAGQYCDTAPQDRQHPVNMHGGKLVYEVASQCVGNPDSPVGIYNGTEQNQSQLVGVEPNGTKFTAECVYTHGEYIQTNAAAAPDAYPTGSEVWIHGKFPHHIEGNIPFANAGFALLHAGGVEVPDC